MYLTTTQWIVLVVLVVASIGLVLAMLGASSGRRRHLELKRRFGPEYDRAVEQHGNVPLAERELLAREKRIEQLHLRPLPGPERAQFGASWEHAQARFVDDPSGAVREADQLIKLVMGARGYVVEHYEQRVADLSVEHAQVVQHYRAARALSDLNREARANTEDLRQAFVHYRALFTDLLEQPQHLDPQLSEVHA
jgi:hypothetical protein